MSDTTRSTPACDLSGIREAVCVHTDKITDSCLAKDCIEDLHVYLTVSRSVRSTRRSAQRRGLSRLMRRHQLDPVPYSAGYYTVDITYYYRVIADAVMQAGRPCTITGACRLLQASGSFRRRDDGELFQPRSYKNCLAKGLAGGKAPRKQSSRLSTR